MVTSSTASPFLCSGSTRGVRDRSSARISAAALPIRPIGLVAFRTHRGEPAAAILAATGTWRCPELPVLDRVLNVLFCPDESGQGDRPFGHAELDRVAAWIKGEVRGVEPGAG